MRAPRWLRAVLPRADEPEDGPEDGLGQSLIEDARWLLRFRRARGRPIRWRRPSDAEARWWREHPVYGRFGDGCRCVAEVDGRRWAVMERDWFGWPDPPRFVWFALAADDRVWAARDFDRWPSGWTMPAPTTTPPP